MKVTCRVHDFLLSLLKNSFSLHFKFVIRNYNQITISWKRANKFAMVWRINEPQCKTLYGGKLFLMPSNMRCRHTTGCSRGKGNITWFDFYVAQLGRLINTSSAAKPLVPRGWSPASVISSVSILAASKSPSLATLPFRIMFFAAKTQDNLIAVEPA